jgi:hypothetical protein
MHYQHFASHAYCRASGPVSKMASQQAKAFCVLRFEVCRSVITVQREFRERFKKLATQENNVFLLDFLGNNNNNNEGHSVLETGSVLFLGPNFYAESLESANFSHWTSNSG